jgi:hypothetical protein
MAAQSGGWKEAGAYSLRCLPARGVTLVSRAVPGGRSPKFCDAKPGRSCVANPCRTQSPFAVETREHECQAFGSVSTREHCARALRVSALPHHLVMKPPSNGI